MNRLTIVPIVEGHGDYESVRILLERIWHEGLGGEYIEILRPIRIPRSKIVQSKELSRAVELAALKLRYNASEEYHLIFLLLDADDDCPGILGPQLYQTMVEARSDLCHLCVIANQEYETWFVAASRSLRDSLAESISSDITDVEERRHGKKWIADRTRHGVYSETVDQPSFTSKMSLGECRENS